jgi:CheY-like chemotaxis protein
VASTSDKSATTRSATDLTMHEHDPCYRVLLVDDLPEMRMLLRLRLEFEPDIDVVGEASNGVEAVRLTKLLSPSAVVLDFEMPEMTGPEAIPLMRAAAPGMGILLYTAAQQFTLADDAAPDATIRKGVSLEKVVAQLRDVLEQSAFDILRLDLGVVPLRQAVTAFDTWAGLNVCVLHAINHNDTLAEERLGGATPEELEALMSVYAHIGYNLQKAARAGADHVNPVIHVFRTTGFLARRALLALSDHRLPAFWKAWGYDAPGAAVSALNLMHNRLMDVLPAGVRDDGTVDIPVV